MCGQSTKICGLSGGVGEGRGGDGEGKLIMGNQPDMILFHYAQMFFQLT
jgi:hypothetical protein